MKICVKKTNGSSITLEVKSSDTISKVKGKVRDTEKFPRDEQRLFFDGRLLEDRKTLAAYNIRNDFTVDLELLSHRVVVEKWNGKSINLEEVKSSDTIYMLKAMVEDREGFSPRGQILSFKKDRLDDGRTLASYEIRKYSTVKLVLRSPLVYVKKPNGKTITLEINSTGDKISKLKELIWEKEGFLPKEQMLFFLNENTLEDATTLEYNQIKHESTVKLELRSYHVLVRKPNGKSFKLEVKSSDTIYMLKAKVLDMEKLLPDNQKLSLSDGKPLKGRRTLASYNIRRDSSVQLELN